VRNVFELRNGLYVKSTFGNWFPFP